MAAAMAKLLRGGRSAAASSQPLLPAIARHLGSSPAAGASSGPMHKGLLGTRQVHPQQQNLMRMRQFSGRRFMSTESEEEYAHTPLSFRTLGFVTAIGYVMTAYYMGPATDTVIRWLLPRDTVNVDFRWETSQISGNLPEDTADRLRSRGGASGGDSGEGGGDSATNPATDGVQRGVVQLRPFGIRPPDAATRVAATDRLPSSPGPEVGASHGGDGPESREEVLPVHERTPHACDFFLWEDEYVDYLVEHGIVDESVGDIAMIQARLGHVESKMAELTSDIARLSAQASSRGGPGFDRFSVLVGVNVVAVCVAIFLALSKHVVTEY
ncbi:hypothetical protein ACP70R_032326 [Stipagrostis hirtigluma subsp. patula]